MRLKTIAILLGALLAVPCLPLELTAKYLQKQSQKTFDAPHFASFDYTSISHHILVKACAHGSAAEKDVTLILDTGTNRTTLSPELISLLKLPRLGPSTTIGTGGVAAQSSVYDLPELQANGYKTDHLRAGTDEFPRGVDGLIGMDFLKQFVVVLDYPHRRWALMDGEFDDVGLREIKSLPFVRGNFDKIFVASLLPSGAKVYLQLDTGADIGADAMLHEDSIAGLKLGRPIAKWGLQDATGDYGVPVYPIPWIDIGDLRIKPATIAVHPTSSPHFDELPTGLIGVQVLERYVVEINSRNRFVRLFGTRHPSSREAGRKRR
jgi:hypothetical protein